MTERWFTQTGEVRVEEPWRLLREWRRNHVVVTAFYPTPVTDGMRMVYVRDGEFWKSELSLWQMRADVYQLVGSGRRYLCEIYRACSPPQTAPCCRAAALFGEVCRKHYPRRYVPSSRDGVERYFSGLPGRLKT